MRMREIGYFFFAAGLALAFAAGFAAFAAGFADDLAAGFAAVFPFEAAFLAGAVLAFVAILILLKK